MLREKASEAKVRGGSKRKGEGVYFEKEKRMQQTYNKVVMNDR